MLKTESNRTLFARLRGGGRRRLGALGLAGTVALLLVATLLQAPGSSASASAAGTEVTVYGWPAQAGLSIFRSNCTGGEIAADDWEFGTGTTAEPQGPTTVGWTPTGLGGGYGIDAGFPDAGQVDVFSIDVYAPAGQTKGFAQFNFTPSGGNIQWRGYTDDFVTTTPGWQTVDASGLAYDWFRFTNGTYDGTFVADTNIADFTSTNGSGVASGRVYFGCDGNQFFVDRLQFGNNASGWQIYDFEDYRTPTVTLSFKNGRIDTCHVSAASYPQVVKFQGRISPGGSWQGEQYVGRRNGHWRVVARGSTSGTFGYSAKVFENSYFDASRPWTVDYRYHHSSPDLYVPAFPKITVRAASTTVRQGKLLRFSGTIKPGKKLSYTPLRAEAKGKRWAPFQSMGTRKTDAKGNFSFTIKNPRPGWARINILTKTEKDLTSALTPRAIIYEVLKPKKKKRNVGNNNQTSDPVVSGGEQEDPTPTPQDPPPPFVPRLVDGYGNCGWYPTGGPPRGRIEPGQPLARLVPGVAGSRALAPDGEPVTPQPKARGAAERGSELSVPAAVRPVLP